MEAFEGSRFRFLKLQLSLGPDTLNTPGHVISTWHGRAANEKKRPLRTPVAKQMLDEAHEKSRSPLSASQLEGTSSSENSSKTPSASVH